MDTKLTLKLDEDIIEKAKLYARKKNTSLSQLVESYLNLLTQEQTAPEITPLVKSLSGVISLSHAADPKSEYKKRIIKKYSK